MYAPADERQGQLESLSMIIHQHLTSDACFLRPVNKLCGKQLAAKMRDETQEREAKERGGGRRRGVASHPRYAEMEKSVNNRKIGGPC